MAEEMSMRDYTISKLYDADRLAGILHKISKPPVYKKGNYFWRLGLCKLTRDIPPEAWEFRCGISDIKLEMLLTDQKIDYGHLDLVCKFDMYYALPDFELEDNWKWVEEDNDELQVRLYRGEGHPHTSSYKLKSISDGNFATYCKMVGTGIRDNSFIHYTHETFDIPPPSQIVEGGRVGTLMIEVVDNGTSFGGLTSDMEFNKEHFTHCIHDYNVSNLVPVVVGDIRVPEGFKQYHVINPSEI